MFHSVLKNRFFIAKKRQLYYQQQKAQEFIYNNYDPSSFLQAKTDAVKVKINNYYAITSSTKCLEVGSGAHGLIFFMGITDAVGVDPLAEEYKRLFPKWQHKAKTIAAEGEKMPFPDQHFDLILSDNVIDHARDPKAILYEICRVLKPGGVLYFTVHIHHPIYHWASNMYQLLKALRIPITIGPFADHTVHLTHARIRSWISELPLKLESETEDIQETIKEARKARKRHFGDWLKNYFFKNATYEIIARRL